MNDETVYLVCPRRRNNPRIHIQVCTNACRWCGVCPVYRNYRQPGLFDTLPAVSHPNR